MPSSILGQLAPPAKAAPDHATGCGFLPDPAAAGKRDKEGHYGMGERSESSGLCGGLCWCSNSR